MSNKLLRYWLSTRFFAQGRYDPKDVRTILNLINVVGADLQDVNDPTSNPALATLSQRRSIMGSRVRLAALNASLTSNLDEPDESDDPPTSASV